MIERLKELVKAAKTKQDALEVLHIEAQNVKIQLFNKGYKVITTPGAPGPDFDEELDKNQLFNEEDKELVSYFETVRGLKEAVDDFKVNKLDGTNDKLQQEFVSIVESKQQ